MCGIAGFVLQGDDEEVALRLRQRLARRGPDGAWFERAGEYGLVQTRLSVVDLSERVRYPLRNESGDLLLLFNGEIYEHQGLRRELEGLGHKFSTDCDAEVVVHGYEQWGAGVFGRVDGMFALALYHAPTRELTLARDPLGIKPLVYCTGERFAFSSDAVSLVSAGLSQGMIDEASLGAYCRFHYIPPPATGLHDLLQLLPGHLLLRGANGKIRTQRWRAKPFSVPTPMSRTIDLAEAEAALDASVSGQLAADVPVGVFLSSGLDSSLVLDSAVRAGARPKAFTIGFRGHGDYDEVRAAARFAHCLGVPHEVAEITAGFTDTVSLVSDALDQPLGDASAIAMTYLSRCARQEVTVALSGTGGDDLFAGYYRHRAHLLTPAVSRIPLPMRRLLAASAGARGSERRSMFHLARSYAARLGALSQGSALSQYHQLVGSASSPLLADLIAPLGATQPLAPNEFDLDLQIREAGSTLRAIQATELETYLPGDLLLKEDRTSMAVGLEVRVPLLANRLLELAERTPGEQKIGLLAGKRVLREIARKRLPHYISRARKRGFAVPLDAFFRGQWQAEAIEWFSEVESSIIDGAKIAAPLGKGTLPATDAWALATLVGWAGAIDRARQRRKPL